MKKRIIALLLVAVMTLGLLAGCKKDDKKDANFDGVLRVGIVQSATISSYTENDFTKWIEEQLGFELEFVYYSGSGSEACQQFALDCTANKIDELPDVMWGLQEMSNYTLGDLGEDGYIMDLKPYLTEEYFPNFMEALKDVPEDDRKTAMEKGINPDDGGYYGMPLIAMEYADNVGNFMYINKNWLQKLNLKSPTTIEELETVLRAFKDGDPNGNGDADEIPILAGSAGGQGITEYIMNAYIYWDPANIYNVQDGKVYSPIVQDAYREGLKTLNRFYEDGLIGEMSYSGAPYTDFINMNTPQDQVAKAGIWFGHPSIYTDSQTTILDEYEALPYLQDAGTGLGGYTVFHENTVKWCSWIMSHTEGTGADEAAMKFLDLMYSDEAMTRMRFGAKDIYWHYGEEGTNFMGGTTNIYIDDDSAFFGGDSTWGRNGNCIMNHANYSGVTGTSVPGSRSAEVSRLMTETWENVCLVGKRPQNTAENLVYTSEDFAIREDLHSRYWGYYSEAVTHFIIGERDINDDKEWNAYKTELDNLGRVQLEGVAQRAYNKEQGK